MLTALFRVLRRLFIAVLALLAIVYVAQLPFRTPAAPAEFTMLAHRGVHQTFHRRDLHNDTCTATRIDAPRHAFLENTLPSMQAAFDAGATVIEIDVHRTADEQLVVWHDWTVDCRTQGSGETRAHTLAQLQMLDAGYGYTADNGASYPFRGQGVGMIKSLPQVLQAFPDAHFLIDQKDRNPATTALVAKTLDEHGAASRVCLMAKAHLNAQYLDTPPATENRCTMADRQQIKRCVVDYLTTGWTGYLPASCTGQTLTLPDWALMRLLWGWPGTFIDRIRASGGRVQMWTDDPERALALRTLGVDGILTDRIELMGCVQPHSSCSNKVPAP